MVNHTLRINTNASKALYLPALPVSAVGRQIGRQVANNSMISQFLASDKFKKKGGLKMSRLTIRFSESEDLKLSRLAAESGMPKSQYIRNLLNNTNFQSKNNTDSTNLNENISQIAESMNNVSIFLNDINSHLKKQNQLLNLLVDFSKKSNSKIEMNFQLICQLMMTKFSSEKVSQIIFRIKERLK